MWLAIGINRDYFHRLVVAHPSIVFSLFKSLSRRLRETSDQLLETRR
jgi:CRP-like cAMP-binding protein